MIFIRFYNTFADLICNFNLICLSLKLVLKYHSGGFAGCIHPSHFTLNSWFCTAFLVLFIISPLSSKLETKKPENYMLCVLLFLYNLWDKEIRPLNIQMYITNVEAHKFFRRARNLIFVALQYFHIIRQRRSTIFILWKSFISINSVSDVN